MPTVPTVSDTYTGDEGALMARQKSLTEAIQQGYKQAPTVQQSLASAVESEEGMIGPLAEERGNIVKALFEHDKNLASRYAEPTSPMYIEDPLARERAVAAPESTLWGALSRLNALIGTRKALLGDVISRGMDIYTAGLKAQEAELENVWKQLERLERKEKEEEDKRRWEAEYALKVAELGKKAGEETEAERKRRITSELAIDVQKGTTLKDAIKKYATELSPDDILQVYNIYSPYGPAKETPEELAVFGVKVGKETAQAQEEKRDTENTIRAFEELRDAVKNNVWDLFNPTSAIGEYHRTKTDVLTQLLAKLVERNRISDKDRTFYLNQTKPQALDLVIPGRYEARLNGVIDSLKTRLGLGTARLKNPQTGEVFEYDSTSDPDYLEDLRRGFVPQ